MASATLQMNSFEMFGDEVYTSTDLNRRSGEVLNHASKRPVTISRNNEQFALVRRELAATLFRTVNHIQGVVTVLLGVQSALAGEVPSPVVSWLTILDKEDLQKLSSEVLMLTAKALSQNVEWVQVEHLIHEWRESALAAQSGILDQAMYHDAEDLALLPSPEEVVVLAEKSDAQEECSRR